MANRKLNYVDGKMLKVQETKIPHGGYNKFFEFIQGVLEDKYMLALCAKIQATQKPVEVFRFLHKMEFTCTGMSTHKCYDYKTMVFYGVTL